MLKPLCFCNMPKFIYLEIEKNIQKAFYQEAFCIRQQRLMRSLCKINFLTFISLYHQYKRDADQKHYS